MSPANPTTACAHPAPCLSSCRPWSRSVDCSPNSHQTGLPQAAPSDSRCSFGQALNTQGMPRYVLCHGPMGLTVTLSEPRFLPAPGPLQPANSCGFMAPGSVLNRGHLFPHLSESWPRVRGLHRPHFCFCQCCGCGHAHRGLRRDCAGPAPGEAGGWALGTGTPGSLFILLHHIWAAPSCPSAQSWPFGTNATV